MLITLPATDQRSLYLYPLCTDLYRKYMMTSSNGNIFSVTGHLAGNSPVPGEFPAQRPVTRSFDVFFDLRLNKRLSKQLHGWWFETLWFPLWRHCNGKYVYNLHFMSFPNVDMVDVVENLPPEGRSYIDLISISWPLMARRVMPFGKCFFDKNYR